MGRGRSPARGRSHPVQPKEVDKLASDALSAALAAWNTRLRYNQVTGDLASAKWMANGNVEIILKLDTSSGTFNLNEFTDFMENQLSSPCEVRMDEGNILLVAENDTILQAVPQYRFRWRVAMARYLEAFYSVVFKLGLLGLALLVVFGLPAIFPGFYHIIWGIVWGAIKNFFAALFGATPGNCE